MINVDELKFDDKGIIPAVVVASGDVLKIKHDANISVRI